MASRSARLRTVSRASAGSLSLGITAARGRRQRSGAVVGHHHRAAQPVLEFAHIARPGVGQQGRKRVLAQSPRTWVSLSRQDWLRRKCRASAGMSDKRSRKGGRMQGQHAEPIKKIFAKAARWPPRWPGQCARRRSRARQPAANGWSRPSGWCVPARSAADSFATPAPDRRSRRGTRCRRRPLRSSRRDRWVAPVNEPRSWPNSSDWISAGAMAPQLTATKAPLARPRLLVYGLRGQLLAAAAFAADENGRIDRATFLICWRKPVHGRLCDRSCPAHRFSASVSAPPPCNKLARRWALASSCSSP
jgi:hypothetical protein